MKAILRTNDFSENFKIVKVLKNPISEQINLAEVEYEGKVFITGGILCKLDDITFEVLDGLTNEEQWKLLLATKLPILVP